MAEILGHKDHEIEKANTKATDYAGELSEMRKELEESLVKLKD